MKRPALVSNPFYEVKADDMSLEQASKIFVREASPIWEDVQQPLNQIIRGPRGAGKTILLKKLSYLDGDRVQPHLGIYVQISRIANVFRQLFPKPEKPERATLERAYQLVFADYLALEAIKELATTLSHFPDSIAAGLYSELLDGQGEAKSAQDVTQFCIHRQRKIERDSKKWELNHSCSWKPLFDLPATLNRLSILATQTAKDHLSSGNSPFFLLLDESAPIATQCQQVVNSLLQRGRAFRTKLAVRPYEWQALETHQGLRLEPDTDFRRLELVYPDELTDDYVERALRILNRLLSVKIVEPKDRPKGWPKLSSLEVEAIFPGLSRRTKTYSGLRDICALSSSNPQNLLSICSWLFSRANKDNEWGESEVPSLTWDLQHNAMVEWAKDQEQAIPDPGVKLLLPALLRRLASNEGRGASLAVHVKEADPGLFESDHLPPDIGAVLMPGFSLGFLRSQGSEPLPWDSVPSRFWLSRSLLPAHDISLRTGKYPEIEIGTEFVRSHVREQFGVRSGLGEDLTDKRLSAFLSTSFSDFLAPERRSIKTALSGVGIDCRDIDDLKGGQLLFSNICSAIRRHAISIFSATEPRPYTLLELGLCAGARKPKPVICVFNDGDQYDTIKKLPEFLKVLQIITFSFEPSRLEEMALKVRSYAEQLLEGPSDFERMSNNGLRLRPMRARSTVFASFPESSVWNSVIHHLRERLESIGMTLITEDDAALSQANKLQVPIFCTSMAEFAIIDTSGYGRPDLLQCFKLGVALARRRDVLWLEREGMSHRQAFSSLPVEHVEWQDERDLTQRVLAFINAKRKAANASKDRRKGGTTVG